jgi:hypothetical protein
VLPPACSCPNAAIHHPAVSLRPAAGRRASQHAAGLHSNTCEELAPAAGCVWVDDLHTCMQLLFTAPIRRATASQHAAQQTCQHGNTHCANRFCTKAKNVPPVGVLGTSPALNNTKGNTAGYLAFPWAMQQGCGTCSPLRHNSSSLVRPVASSAQLSAMLCRAPAVLMSPAGLPPVQQRHTHHVLFHAQAHSVTFLKDTRGAHPSPAGHTQLSLPRLPGAGG